MTRAAWKACWSRTMRSPVRSWSAPPQERRAHLRPAHHGLRAELAPGPGRYTGWLVSMNYVRATMPRAVVAVRLAGFARMAAGAWWHTAWLLLVGLALVILAWLCSVIGPRSEAEASPRVQP